MRTSKEESKAASWFWLLLAFGGAFSSRAGALPDLVVPEGIGVNIHFTRGHERDLDLIAAGGFKWIRMDFSWGGTESRKGEYNWTAYDELTANLEKRGVRAYYILDYSNPLYEETVVTKNPVYGGEQRDTASPQHPESIAAFARWAGAAVRHFHGRQIVWEIWNEPNITFWKPKPDVAQYSALALAAAKAVREADPEVVLVGPASSGFPWEFLESFLASGILQHLDGVSVHPYRNYQKAPETAAEDYRRLRQMIERHAPNPEKAKLPILSGEWGYASHTKGLSLETQAAFAARQQLVNLSERVPISIWYDWKNDGPDAGEREHNFGTVTQELSPKPAYVALQTLAKQLAGCRFVRREPLPDQSDYFFVFRDAAGAERWALWATKEKHATHFTLPSGVKTATITNSSGEKALMNPEGASSFSIDLELAPKYVRFQ